MNSKSLASLLAIALAHAGHAAELPMENIRDSEQRQEQLSAETRQLAAALETMLGEYQRNNLAGTEVETVKALRLRLSQLSADEMRQVIDLLQRARAINDQGAATRTVADAYTAQKQIVVSIQRILADHARAHEARELARQIDELADRQARNLQNGIELGRMASGVKPENFEAVMEAQLETQRGEQGAITEELRIAADKLRKFAANPENADVAQKFRTGAEQIERVAPQSAEAADALKDGKLFKAVASEKASRDELRRIARAIAPRERGAEALRQAERELADIIRAQQDLKTETGLQKQDADFEKWIDQRLTDVDPNKTLPGRFRQLTRPQMSASKELRERFDREQAAKATALAKLEDTQGEIAARSDFLGQDLAELPQAAAALRDATARMQEARSAMQEADAPAAQQQQEAALARMQAAHTEIRRMAEEAELLAANSGDKVQDLQRLKDAVENLAKQEDAIAKAATPDRAQQAAVAQRTQQLAQRAAEIAPAAGAAMEQAAKNAQAAAQAMNNNQQPAGQQQARQAAQQLAEAARQIAQELANAQDAQQQMERAAAMLAELAKLIQAEHKLDLDTMKAAALPADRMAAALRELAQQQAAVERQTNDFKATLPGSMDAAVTALNEAGNAMKTAQEQLEKGDAPAARTAEQEALRKLFDVQKDMSQLAKAAQQMLGEEFADAAQMAAAANQLAQALQQVDGAQEMLEQAAEQLGQRAAQNAAEAAQQAAQAAQMAAQQAQGAQQQAQQTGNQPAAQQAGQAVQQAQAAAQAAMQAAQAAQQMANQSGQPAQQSAQQAAQQAGQAAQAAQQAAQAAQAAQQAAAQAGQPGQQAGQAMQSAQQAAQAARQAQQMANAAARAAQAGAQQGGQTMQQAAQQLAQAAQQAGQAAAQGGQLSPGAQQAAQQAAQQLAQAAQQAMQGQNASAQQAAQQAARQLAQAAGMAAAMQAGIASQSPNQGQMPGQGMQGAGKQPGEGQGSGPTQQSNDQPSQGATGYKPGSPEEVQRAARAAALKKAGFLGLPAREREAIQQSLGEKYPEEFGAMVEQYLLNLANESAKK